MSQFDGREVIQQWVVNVGGDIEDLRRAMRQVTSETRAAQRSAQRAAQGIRESFRQTFTLIRSGSVAAAAGLGVVVGVLGTVSELTLRAERRNRALARGLKLTGDEAKSVRRDFDETADSLRSLGGVLRRDFMDTSARMADMTQMRGTSPDEVKAMAVAVEGLTKRFENHGRSRQQIERIVEQAHRGDMEGMRKLLGDTSGLMSDVELWRAFKQASKEGIEEIEKAGRGPRAQLKALRDEIAQVASAAGKAAGIGETVNVTLSRMIKFVRGLKEPIAESVSGFREWVEQANLVDHAMQTVQDRGLEATQLGIRQLGEEFRSVWDEVRIRAAEVFNWISEHIPTDWAETLLTAWSIAMVEMQNMWDRFTFGLSRGLEEQAPAIASVWDRILGTVFGVSDEEMEGFRELQKQARTRTGAFEGQLASRRAQREREAAERLTERVDRLRSGEAPFDVESMRREVQERRNEFAREQEERRSRVRREQEERRERARETGGRSSADDEQGRRDEETQSLQDLIDGLRMRPENTGQIDTIQTAIGGMRVGASAQVAHLRRIERAAEKTARNTDPQHPARRSTDTFWRAE